MADRARDKILARTVLVIAGHGSTRNPDSAAPTFRLAEDIGARNLFAGVKAAFVKQEPKLAAVLGAIDADDIVIVPNMACEGYITATVIPRDAALSGALTTRSNPHTGAPQRIHLTAPIGTDARIGDAIAQRVRRVLETAGITEADTGLLVIGHGSEKSRESYNQTQALAEGFATRGIGCVTALAFLEEDPRIPGWRKALGTPNVIAVPFLIATGLHGAEDIPAQLGLESGALNLSATKDREAVGPFEIDGRKLWYLDAIGDDPVLADIITDRARAALQGKD